MALVSGQRSTLNPNAPIFIPYVYRQVEDFSPEWWELVKTSTWFRDFWLSEHPEGSFDGSAVSDGDEIGDFLPENFDMSFDEGLADLEDEFEELIKWTEDEEKQKPLDGFKVDLEDVFEELIKWTEDKEKQKPLDGFKVDLEDVFEELIKWTEDEEKQKPLDGFKVDLEDVFEELIKWTEDEEKQKPLDGFKVDLEDVFEELIKWTEDEEKQKPLDGFKVDLKGLVKELSIPNSGKWRNVETPPAKAVKNGKKGGYWLSNKTSPRRIHQIHQPR